MTLRELLKALEEWPLDYEVAIDLHDGRVIPIGGVSGAAGGAIDGRDSVTLIQAKTYGQEGHMGRKKGGGKRKC